MKRVLAMILVLGVLMLPGCQCKHKWVEADCENPKTCSKCDATEGEALGHDWQDANCTDPEICATCGQTQGVALGHDWTDATCDAPKTCATCDKTQGEALGHTWVEATYDAPKTCTTCGELEGTALLREDLGMTQDEMAAALELTLQYTGYYLEYWGEDEDGWPTYDVYEKASGEYTQVYVSFEPTQDGTKTLAVLAVAEDANNTNAVQVMGVVGGIAVAIVEPEYDLDKMNTVFSGQPYTDGDMAYFLVEDKGLIVELDVYNNEYALFWVYPAVD